MTIPYKPEHDLHISDPCSNVYGLARTLLAICTAFTLAFNGIQVLFTPAVGLPHPPVCDGGFWTKLSLFCIAHNHLDLAKWLCVMGLLIVASGWRPRMTAVFHAWISYSVFYSVSVREGGDQAALVLTVLMIPIALVDSRRWHWSPPAGTTLRRPYPLMVAWSAFTMIRLQIAAIYFVAAISKFAVTEWKDGTALYYWLPYFSAPHWLVWMTGYGWVAGLATWGALFIEITLASALVMQRRYWAPLLAVGMLFHLGIAMLFGLWAFSLTMTAALILYLRPPNRPFPIRVLMQIPLTAKLRALGKRYPLPLPEAES